MILLGVLFIRKLFVVLSANITVLTSWGLADVSMEHRLRFAHLCASQLWESVFLLWSSIEEKKKERKKGDDKCTGLESEVLWEYLDRNSITRREWEQRWRERAPGFFFLFDFIYLFLLLLLVSISGEVIVALFGVCEWHLVQQREDVVATSPRSMKRRNTFSSHSDTKYTRLSNEPACVHNYNPVRPKDVNISYTLHVRYRRTTSKGRLYYLDCILFPSLYSNA